jgi:hypothetical protein
MILPKRYWEWDRREVAEARRGGKGRGVCLH